MDKAPASCLTFYLTQAPPSTGLISEEVAYALYVQMFENTIRHLQLAQLVIILAKPTFRCQDPNPARILLDTVLPK